jgi:hypothetical protein
MLIPKKSGAYYFLLPDAAPKVNHCSDWACAPGFYANGTVCVPQPTCKRNETTYQRDSITGEIAVAANGAYSCVPCSRCMDGSQVGFPSDRHFFSKEILRESENATVQSL